MTVEVPPLIWARSCAAAHASPRPSNRANGAVSLAQLVEVRRLAADHAAAAQAGIAIATSEGDRPYPAVCDQAPALLEPEVLVERYRAERGR